MQQKAAARNKRPSLVTVAELKSEVAIPILIPVPEHRVPVEYLVVCCLIANRSILIGRHVIAVGTFALLLLRMSVLMQELFAVG